MKSKHDKKQECLKRLNDMESNEDLVVVLLELEKSVMLYVRELQMGENEPKEPILGHFKIFLAARGKELPAPETEPAPETKPTTKPDPNKP